MYHRKQSIGVALAACLLASSAHADFKVTIPNVEFISDGVNPTSGTFPILLEVEGAGAPNVSAPISSYNFQLDVTSVTGPITMVSSLTGSAGDLFTGVSSQTFPFQAFSFGTSPLGFSEGANTVAQPSAPAPSTLNTPIVLTNISFTVPAGDVGTFNVDFVPNTLQFFDDSFPVGDEYAQGVNLTGGTVTITAIPEPNAFVMFGLIGGVALMGRRIRKYFART